MNDTILHILTLIFVHSVSFGFLFPFSSLFLPFFFSFFLFSSFFPFFFVKAPTRKNYRLWRRLCAGAALSRLSAPPFHVFFALLRLFVVPIPSLTNDLGRHSAPLIRSRHRVVS